MEPEKRFAESVFRGGPTNIGRLLFCGENRLLVRLTKAGLLGLATVALFWSCSAEDSRSSMPPDYPSDTWDILVSADDSTLFRHFRDLGYREAGLRWNRLAGFVRSDEVMFEDRLQQLKGPMERVAKAFAEEYNEESGLYNLRKILQETPEYRKRRAAALKASSEIPRELEGEERIAVLRAAIDQLVELELEGGACHLESDVALTLIKMGKERESLEHWRRAIELARTAHYTNMQCQFLGTIGVVYGGLGEVDSLWAAWDEGIRVATRVRAPYHAARILSFYSSSMTHRGRPALAMEYAEQAQETCRRFKGGEIEFRYIMRAAQVYAILGLWGSVERHLNRAQVLLREIEAPTPYAPEHQIITLRRLQGNVLEARGQLEEAVTHYENFWPEIEQLDWPRPKAGYLYGWARVLVAMGKTDEAYPLIASLRTEDPDAPELLHLQALVAFESREDDLALSAIRQFQVEAESSSAAYRRLVVEGDLLAARIAKRGGDEVAYRDALDGCLNRLGNYLLRLDAGASGYLFYSQVRGVRDELHQAVSRSPRAGYELELAWRELPRFLGKEYDPVPGTPVSASSAQPVASLQRILHNGAGVASGSQRLPTGSWMQRRLGELDGVHLLYSVGPESVVRWTVDAGALSSDTLQIEPDELRELTFRAVRAMAEDPGDTSTPPELMALLRSLAEVILPGRILDGSMNPGLLLISPDDYLSLLPFETLNRDGGGGYRPLLLEQDVAYLRYAGRDEPVPASGQGIILADPALSSRVTQRYAGLRSLERGGSEAEVILSYFPDSRLLKGEAATKAGMMKNWERAPFLYTAAHFVRDPEAPYLAFMPLTNHDDPTRPQDSRLYIEDIRAADFGGCRLVVLSGCASGAPYLLTDAVAPSFGDAFLDAGAGAVIHTFWTVRDDAAEGLMHRFAERWAGEGQTPVQALCGARRELLRKRIPHPFVWASYSITLRRL